MEEEITLVAVYVDDFLNASLKTKTINEIWKYLADEFEVKDLEIYHQGCIQEILPRFHMADRKPISTLMDLSTKLTKRDDITLPDIAFAVCILAQFNNNYSFEHWKAAKCILRYLKERPTWYWFTKRIPIHFEVLWTLTGEAFSTIGDLSRDSFS